MQVAHSESEVGLVEVICMYKSLAPCLIAGILGDAAGCS
jgi:hypothetical protein